MERRSTRESVQHSQAHERRVHCCIAIYIIGHFSFLIRVSVRVRFSVEVTVIVKSVFSVL